jgi:hypothetical protein
MTDANPEMSEATFRAPKRRKIFRTRPQEDEAGDAQPHTEIRAALTLGPKAVDTPEDGNSEISMADILRRRKAGKVRKAGLEFGAAKSWIQTTSPPPHSIALVPIADDKAALDSAGNRFMPERGPNKVTEVTSKHM